MVSLHQETLHIQVEILDHPRVCFASQGDRSDLAGRENSSTKSTVALAAARSYYLVILLLILPAAIK